MISKVVYGSIRPEQLVVSRILAWSIMYLVLVLALLLSAAVDRSLQEADCPQCNLINTGVSRCMGNDYTPQLGVNHCGELDQTVSGLERVFHRAGLNIAATFFEARGFLRTLAFVETRDGRNWTCCEAGGIWKVNYESLESCIDSFMDIQTIFITAIRGFGLAGANYDCPANSAFGAVLLMLCHMVNSNSYPNVTAAAADLPTERDSFPSFYFRYYCHPDCGEDEAIEKFNAGMQEYLNSTCGTEVESCSEAFDIIVLLDSSGSIGSDQFEFALTAVADLASRYTIGSNYTRFGVILYSHVIHNTQDGDVIALDEYTDSADLTAAILSLPYRGGGTLTGNTITYATEHGFNTTFGARERGLVPQVLIVATDGRSCDDVTAPSQAAARAGIDLFSIGIGDGPDQDQLSAIAGGVSSRVFNTKDYRHLIGLSPLLAAETCKAQVSVPPGTQVGYNLVTGTVKYFQITIPENCSQSLVVNFVADQSSGSVLVYASFTIPNPNERLHDFKWNVTAEPVNAVISSAECNKQQKQEPSPGIDQPCSLPCQNGGSCVSPDLCVCTQGWTGTDCSQAICSFPCQNGGHCSAPDRCRCTAEWAGQDCSSAICSESEGSCVPPDACGCAGNWLGMNCSTPICSQPCQNGGSCVSPDLCVCTHGWTGTDCSQAVCSFPCHNGGHCSAPDRCTCTTGWEGQDCSSAMCSPVCANGGTCVSPQQCSCVEGWTGSSCDTPVCSPSCENGGTCVAPDNCTCSSGWTGDTCSQAICSLPCQIGGSCVFPDLCVCTEGWTGTNCSQAVCNFPCHNGGHCSAPDRCTCTTGWEGQDCSSAMCSPVCANGGTCVSPQQCSCVEGWTGSSCDTPLCSTRCENGGTCVAPDNCTCSSGWTGDTCSEAICSLPCRNGGSCVSPDLCVCTEGWTGTDCSQALCSFSCYNGGHCSAPDRCTCTTGWEGQDCSSAICRFECANNGVCVSPDTCECSNGWQGRNCTTPVCDPACLHGGTCVQPDCCQCPPEWSGCTCNEPVCTHTCENGGICVVGDLCDCSAAWTGYNCSTAVCSPPCLNGGTCAPPGDCRCREGWTGTNCETALKSDAPLIASQYIAAIVTIPSLLLFLAVTLILVVACVAVRYRRQGGRTVTEEESTPPRRTSLIQEVGQTIRKKLSIVSGNFAYTEIVRIDSHLHSDEIAEDGGVEEEEKEDQL